MSGGQVLGEGTKTGKTKITFYVSALEGKIEILQECPMPLPQCEQCGMHMREVKMWTHKRMDICDRDAEVLLRKR